MTHADDGRTVDAPSASSAPSTNDTTVTVHECSPDRTVFTENGNADGWIATDTTVELDR
jgi:hypothetical protein